MGRTDGPRAPSSATRLPPPASSIRAARPQWNWPLCTSPLQCPVEAAAAASPAPAAPAPARLHTSTTRARRFVFFFYFAHSYVRSASGPRMAMASQLASRRSTGDARAGCRSGAAARTAVGVYSARPVCLSVLSVPYAKVSRSRARIRHARTHSDNELTGPTVRCSPLTQTAHRRGLRRLCAQAGRAGALSICAADEVLDRRKRTNSE